MHVSPTGRVRRGDIRSECGQVVVLFAILIPVFSVGLFESGADPARQSLIGYLNIWDHMDEFARGIVDTRRIVYYLSGTAFFLLLAATILASKKETP